MVCGCCKVDEEWQQDYMKQFKVSRKNAKKKNETWCERALLVHLNAKLGFFSMMSALKIGDLLAKTCGKVPGVGVGLTPILTILDLVMKLIGAILGVIAYLVCFIGGYVVYRFKTVPVYVRLPMSTMMVVLGMESYLKQEVKNGLVVQRNDPVNEQVLVDKVLLVPGAPWNVSYSLQVAPGRLTKWASMFGRSVGIMLEITILSKTPNTTDIKIDCTFADDICCCCGRIFPPRSVLKGFAQKLLLKTLKVKLMRDDCNKCYLSKTPEDDSLLDEMVEALRKKRKSTKVGEDGLTSMLEGVADESGLTDSVGEIVEVKVEKVTMEKVKNDEGDNGDGKLPDEDKGGDDEAKKAPATEAAATKSPTTEVPEAKSEV